VITQEMVSQLRVGMTREQVRFILGTPLINDPFKPNQWEYVFRLQRGTGSIELRQYVVKFKDDKLESFTGETSPTENRGQATMVTVGKTPKDLKIEKMETGANPSAPLDGLTQTPPAQNPAPADTTTTPTVETSAPPTTSQAAASPAAETPIPPEVEASLRATVEAWRTAWSNRAPLAYLGFYSPNYQVQNMSRAEWEQSRKDKLMKPKRISVLFGNLRLQLIAPDQAKVVFRQVYESDILREVGVKTLLMRNVNGRWLIEFEQFSPQ
jgi:outer membrane protein assembly factor BamE